MEKKTWLSFLSTKIKSQISRETVERLQTWGFALFALLSFGFGVNALSQVMGKAFLYETKIIFLVLLHAFLILGFYLPALLEKGEKSTSRLLGLRNFTCLTLSALTLVLITVVATMLSFQLLGSIDGQGGSGFFMFVAGTNAVLSVFYLCAGIFYFVSLSLFPQALIKVVEKSSKTFYVFLGLHITMAFLLGLGYSQSVKIGSQMFFDQFRIAGLFSLSLGSLLMFVAYALKESSVSALNAIEYEIASGRLERHEDILARYKEAFISKRLFAWIKRLSHLVAQKSHDHAHHTHEAVELISSEKPSEMDIRKVEERYKKADQIYRKLDKINNRFLLCISLFNLTEAEREKIEGLRDQISRELRNAKLELASVRKRIDEKLVAMKNQITDETPVEVPVEKVPLST